MPDVLVRLSNRLDRVHLGRRGLFLLTWGALFALYGVGLLTAPLPEQPVADAVWHELIPADLRAAAWIATGLAAIAAAFRRHPPRDGFGFVALTIMPMVRAASYGYAWVVSLVGEDIGSPRGWVSLAFYAVLVATVVIVSGWPERPLPPRSEPREAA